MAKDYYVYILCNDHRTVYYTGITNNLIRRIFEHKNKVVKGFTKKYNVNKLMYFEQFIDAYEAITREKQIKKYSRKKKIDLIKTINPTMIDLYKTLL